jgi:hypothetical protein
MLYNACISTLLTDLKAIKILKNIKNPSKGKSKGYGTRFARVVSRAKAKAKATTNSLKLVFF